MKLLIPENISDVTLTQFMKYSKLIERTDLNDFEMNKRLVSTFCNIGYHKLNNVEAKDFDGLVTDIKNAINQEAKFVNRFTLNDIEYGFIPNFDKLTSKEFFDLSLYCNEDMQQNLNKIMAILFRPINGKDKFGNYKIETYNGTEDRAVTMLEAPMNVVNGALVFFSNLARELRLNIQKYTDQVQAKVDLHQSTLASGVGTQH